MADLFVTRALLAAGTSLAAGLALTPLVILLARRTRFVARPRSDRWSSRPTALLGGTAIFASSALGFALFAPELREAAGFALAAAVIFGAGLADDLINMRPQYKLLAQIVAACIILASGIHFGGPEDAFITWPLTLLFVVGITNAMNLLDNMDGLAAGIALISAAVIAVGSYFVGAGTVMVASGAIAGACLAFLVFNFHPAKIFMGDCGSMFLGLTLAVMAIKASSAVSNSLAWAVLVPSMALAVPIFDTCFVTIMRTLNGRSISQGGCDHTSHRLVKLGVPEPWAVAILYACSMVVGVLGLAAARLDAPFLLVVAAIITSALVVIGHFLAQVQVYDAPAGAPSGPEAVLAVERFHKKQWATALVDALLAFAAYGIASMLAQAAWTGGAANALYLGAPAPVAFSALGLALAGVYRGSWHHLRTEDVARLLLGSAAGALGAFAAMAVISRQPATGAAIALLYFGVYTGLLFSARGLYLLLRLLGRREAQAAEPVCWLVVAPAGVSAEAIQELIRNSGRPNPPAGLVLLSRGQESLDSVPVLGVVEDLERVLTQVEPAQVVLASPDASERIVSLCRKRGVQCVTAPVAQEVSR